MVRLYRMGSHILHIGTSMAHPRSSFSSICATLVWYLRWFDPFKLFFQRCFSANKAPKDLNRLNLKSLDEGPWAHQSYPFPDFVVEGRSKEHQPYWYVLIITRGIICYMLYDRIQCIGDYHKISSYYNMIYHNLYHHLYHNNILESIIGEFYGLPMKQPAGRLDQAEDLATAGLPRYVGASLPAGRWSHLEVSAQGGNFDRAFRRFQALSRPCTVVHSSPGQCLFCYLFISCVFL